MKVKVISVLEDNYMYLVIEESTRDAIAVDAAVPKRVRTAPPGTTALPGTHSGVVPTVVAPRGVGVRGVWGQWVHLCVRSIPWGVDPW